MLSTLNGATTRHSNRSIAAPDTWPPAARAIQQVRLLGGGAVRGQEGGERAERKAERREKRRRIRQEAPPKGPAERVREDWYVRAPLIFRWMTSRVTWMPPQNRASEGPR